MFQIFFGHPVQPGEGDGSLVLNLGMDGVFLYNLASWWVVPSIKKNKNTVFECRCRRQHQHTRGQDPTPGCVDIAEVAADNS